MSKQQLNAFQGVSHRLNMARVDLLNAEEIACIEALQLANTWPDKWSGTEPTADTVLDKIYADGSPHGATMAVFDFMKGPADG